MRIRAGMVVVEPWINAKECIDCLFKKNAIEYVLSEPVLAYSSLYVKNEPIIEKTLLVLGHDSYVLSKKEEAVECNCTFVIIEKDAWGEAEPFHRGEK